MQRWVKSRVGTGTTQGAVEEKKQPTFRGGIRTQCGPEVREDSERVSITGEIAAQSAVHRGEKCTKRGRVESRRRHTGLQVGVPDRVEPLGTAVGDLYP